MQNTGGTLVEKCCHFFDLMRLIAKAEPIRVYASGAADVNFRDEHHDGRTGPTFSTMDLLFVDFDNGVRGMLELCMFAEGSTVAGGHLGDRRQCQGRGAGAGAGTVFARWCRTGVGVCAFAPVQQDPSNGRSSMSITRSWRPVTITARPSSSTRRFFAMVRDGGVPEVTLEDGLKSVRIGLAAEHSARRPARIVRSSREGQRRLTA
jgi:myo-inositol 2-dehydrogenase/D-chiro-inositol 1-dehydrogenase